MSATVPDMVAERVRNQLGGLMIDLFRLEAENEKLRKELADMKVANAAESTGQ